MEKSPYYQNVRKSHLLNVGKSDVIGFCSKCQKPFSLQYADNFDLVVFWTNRGTNIICVLPLRSVPIHGIDLTKREGIKKDDVTFCYTIPLLLND